MTTVAILDIKGNQVRIGIAAPKYVSIHREGIYNKLAQEPGQKVTAFIKV